MSKSICSVEGCGRSACARGWCNLHYLRVKRHGAPDINLRPELGVGPQGRFWAKVNKNGPPPGDDTLAAGKGPCWLWTGKLSGGPRAGYGHLRVGNANPPAHCYAYELLVGPIPDGLVIDHLCRVRHCVNPAHLEAVPNIVNLMRGRGAPALHARQTHCIHGHEFTPENTYPSPRRRSCKACQRDRSKKYRADLATKEGIK